MIFSWLVIIFVQSDFFSQFIISCTIHHIFHFFLIHYFVYNSSYFSSWLLILIFHYWLSLLCQQLQEENCFLWAEHWKIHQLKCHLYFNKWIVKTSIISSEILIKQKCSSLDEINFSKQRNVGNQNQKKLILARTMHVVSLKIGNIFIRQQRKRLGFLIWFARNVILLLHIQSILEMILQKWINILKIKIVFLM